MTHLHPGSSVANPHSGIQSGVPSPRGAPDWTSATTEASPLTRAKQAIRIPQLWRFYGLKGKPGSSCPSPLRRDLKPSFSIYDEGRRWHDFGTGEGGDAVDFVAKVEGLDMSAAARRLIQWHRDGPAAGAGSGAVMPSGVDGEASAAVDRAEKAKRRSTWPPFRPLSADERRQLAGLRHLDPGAINLACDHGLLLALDSREGTAWVITDRLRVNAQARRLDGLRWHCLPGEPKAWTLPGSEAAWPIGPSGVGPRADILLLEGGPDLLAGFQLVIDAGAAGRVTPVALMGASLKLGGSTIDRFWGRRVILCPHIDASGHGLEAARRWAIQLRGTAGSLDWIDLSGLRRADGSPVKDLCDLMSRGPGGHDTNAGFIAELAGSLVKGGAA